MAVRMINHNGFLLVDAPEASKDFVNAKKFGSVSKIYCTTNKNGHGKRKLVAELSGNYSIIGLAKDLTEEQWSQIVERYDEHCIHGCWPDYTREPVFANQYVFDTATESGHSLLKANNLNPNTTLILKKVV